MATVPSSLNFNDMLIKEDVDLIFTLEEEIASGSFGTVYKGTHLPTNQIMAIKIITPDEDEVPEDLMIEIALLQQCDHKNIVKYYGGYRKGDEIFIAMELCNCSTRDIFDYTEDPLLEKEIAIIARETLKGLEYLHANNFIHRDIKGANILVTDEGEVKLVDFGVSSLNAKKAKTFVGTPYWMAPELIDSKNGMTGYGNGIDIWAVGITCIELAETTPPLSYINPMRALFQIPARDPPSLEKKAKWSPEFHDFIAKCLEKNPKKRPSATELLQHPFVRDCDDNPQIMKDFIKRKTKFEQGGEDWEDDEDEDDMDFEEDFIEDEELANRLNESSSNTSQSPSPQSLSATPSPSITPTVTTFTTNPSPTLLLNVPIIPSPSSVPFPQLPSSQSLPTQPKKEEIDLEKMEDDEDLESWLQGGKKAHQKSDSSSSTDSNSPVQTRSRNESQRWGAIPVPTVPAPPPPSQLPPPPPTQIAPNIPNTPHSFLTAQPSTLNTNQPPLVIGLSSSSPTIPLIDSPVVNNNNLSQSTPLSENQTKVLLSPQNRNKKEDDAILKQKSTMRRPPPTQRGKTRRTTQRNENIRSRANKRIIKDQMAALRALQAKGQKRVEKQERDQQRERENLTSNYKRQLDQLTKNIDYTKKTLERQNKAEMEGLIRSQKEQKRNLTKQQDVDSKALQRDIRELFKFSQKTHLENQKKRLKEQKDQTKQSKKIRTKSEMKLMEKEHKTEIQLNDILFEREQTRTKLFKECELNWVQHTANQKQIHAELQQTQHQEIDILKQQCAGEFEAHNQIFTLRDEELSKLQPLEQKLLQEKHQLQQRNLQEQLDADHNQQSALLITDQRNQKKDYLEMKKKLEKENLLAQKQIAKQKNRSKNEIKMAQQECRSKFLLELQSKDKEFEDELNRQKAEEEEQISLHHKRQRELLLEKQQEEQEELEKLHAKQQIELHQEEMNERMKLMAEHHQKMRELLIKHHQEQTTLVESINETRLVYLKSQHRECSELLETQKKELLGFLQSNADKLLPGSIDLFRKQVEDHFKEAMEQLTSEQTSQLKSLLVETEQQVRTNQASQQQEKEDLDKLQNKQSAELKNMSIIRSSSILS